MRVGKKIVRNRKSPVNVERSTATFLRKFNSFKRDLNRWYLEREDVVDAIFISLLTKQHTLIVGKHGTSKSELTQTIFDTFKDAQHFNLKCTKFMNEDAVFGIANIKKMQEEGVIEYNTEGMLPTSDFAFLDEMLDANDAVLRSMLDVLNERVFRKGRQVDACPLHTAVAATNFFKESEELDAVLDRFLIKVEALPLESEESVVSMFTNFLQREKEPLKLPSFSIKDLQNAREAVKQVSISSEIIQLHQELITEFVRQSGGAKFISDRRKCWTLNLLQVGALLSGRSSVKVEDLAYSRFGLVFIGKAPEEQWFREAYKIKVSSYAKTKDLREKLLTLEGFIAQLTKQVDILGDLDDEKCITLARQIKTAAATLEQRDRTQDSAFPDLGMKFDKASLQAKAMYKAVTEHVVNKLNLEEK